MDMNITHNVGTTTYVSNESVGSHHTLAQIIGSAALLTTIACVGTIGNILIFYAVISQKALRRVKSNYFVCNLALADLTVTALVMPAAVGNVIIDSNESILPRDICKFVAFLMPFTCVVSMLNLMLIGVQRFIGISSLGQQDKKVEKRISVTLVVLSWIWAAMIVSPILIKDPVTQRDLLGYDKAAAMCAWKDEYAPRFTISLVIVAFFIPLAVTALCYFELFSNVIKQSREMSTRMDSGASSKINVRERKLLETVLIVIVVFLLSWGPYCMLLVLDTLEITDVSANESWKRPSAWLGCSNSAFNSIIYGWRNGNFRQGYIECGYKFADFVTCRRFNLYRNFTKNRLHKKQSRRSTQVPKEYEAKNSMKKTMPKRRSSGE